MNNDNDNEVHAVIEHDYSEVTYGLTIYHQNNPVWFSDGFTSIDHAKEELTTLATLFKTAVVNGVEVRS